MLRWQTPNMMTELTAAGFSERQAHAICRVIAQAGELARSEKAKTVEFELQATIRRAQNKVRFLKLAGFALQAGSAVIVAAALALTLR